MLTIRTKCLESFLEAAQPMLLASSGVTRLYFSSHEKKFDLWEWLNKENVKSDPWSTRTRKHQLSCGRGMSLSLGSEARAEFSTLGSSRLSLGVLILLDKSSGSKNWARSTTRLVDSNGPWAYISKNSGEQIFIVSNLSMPHFCGNPIVSVYSVSQ